MTDPDRPVPMWLSVLSWVTVILALNLVAVAILAAIDWIGQ